MLPNLNSAVMAWASPTRVLIVAKRQEDFKTVESYYEKTVSIFRSRGNRTLEMTPDGQRNITTEKIYTDNSLILKNDDVILFGCREGEKFRVIDNVNYSEHGYMEYTIRSDYQ
jgi:hypothetical protein